MTPEQYLEHRKIVEASIKSLLTLLEIGRENVLVPPFSTLRRAMESDFQVGRIIYTRWEDKILWHVVERIIGVGEYKADSGAFYSVSQGIIHKWVKRE